MKSGYKIEIYWKLLMNLILVCVSLAFVCQNTLSCTTLPIRILLRSLKHTTYTNYDTKKCEETWTMNADT